MQEIVWLSHGGPGSGRYPKGSGENPRSGRRRVARKLSKIMKSYNEPGAEKEKRTRDLGKYLSKTEKVGKDKPKVSKAELVAKDINKATNELSSGVLEGMKLVKSLKKSKDYSKGMSDSELQNAIRRIELETRYNSLMNSKNDRGYELTKSALSILGSATAVAASVTGIVATAYTIKKAKR